METTREQKMDTNKYNRIFNFSAGPSALPLPVLERAREALLNFDNTGMSVMEMSHRSKPFDRILERAEMGFRRNLGVPDDYAVLFLQGGASQQFAMVPMNLGLKDKPVDMMHTGVWTKKAISEIKKITPLRLAASSEPQKFRRLPAPAEISLDKNASFVYLCSNNTIYGTQWKTFPETGAVPLVADMSSDILSRAINVSKFGLIFAGAQKNLGPAGLTVVVLRKDLAERASKDLPAIFQYRSHIADGSRYNTPPTFGIYLLALVMEWMVEQGGLPAIERKNEEKAALLYATIDEDDFFSCPVDVAADRSLMNVNFRIKNGDEALEKKFIEEAERAGLSGLKGHRSVGGLRASIYNAQTLDGVRALTQFMQQFKKKNG